MFAEPSRNLGVVPLVGFFVSLQEMGLLLFAYGYYNSGPSISKGRSQNISVFCRILLVVIALSEAYKFFHFGGSVVSLVRVNRMHFNGLASLLIMGMGVRPGARLVVPYIFVGVLISSGFALLFGFLGISPVSPFIAQSAIAIERAELIENSGRFGGMLSSLGVALLILMYFYNSSRRSFQLSPRWRLVLLAASLCTILIMVTSFNRTLGGVSMITIAAMLVFHFRFKAAVLGAVVVGLGLIVGSIFIATNSNVEKQFRERIEIIFQGREAILESVYYGGRENVYEQVIEKLIEYPIGGLPYGVPAFVAYREFNVIPFFYTDVSLLNVFLRYGLLAGGLSVVLLLMLITDAFSNRNLFPFGELNMFAKMLLYAWPVYALISLNYDVLLRHAPILFLTMIWVHVGFYRAVGGQQNPRRIR
tara:strand:- start:139 stop:1395 length:1257 start_codon:yes stop_codon:yes gene_type:complete